jgi:hypothetical protein
MKYMRPPEGGTKRLEEGVCLLGLLAASSVAIILVLLLLPSMVQPEALSA